MKKILLFLIIGLSLNYCKSKEKLSILTGSHDGNYYMGATVLKKILNDSNYDLVIKESNGSYQNIEDLSQGKADLALAQLDTILLFTTLGEEAKKQVDKCLALAPINNESVHLLVNKNSGIKSIKDLKGKKVSYGEEKSGTWITATFLLQNVFQDNLADQIQLQNLEDADALQKVMKGELDAVFLTTSNGSPVLKNLKSEFGESVILLSYTSIVPESLKTMYISSPVSIGTYSWLNEEIEVPVIASFLLVNNSLDPKKVEEIAKFIYENDHKMDEESNTWLTMSKKIALGQMKLGIPYHPSVEQFLNKQ
jgi:uncharacterized protein